ncbi:MAG: patatin-like phospholipase family protein, partial [Bryobacteraceae bacterium]
VLRVMERNNIPVSFIGGVSAGSIVAAAYASGASLDEIARCAMAMRFTDVARWSLSKMGLAGSERMDAFLHRLLKHTQFEEMRIPLGIVATNVLDGQSVCFRGHGSVKLPIRASCSYPGLFQPVRHEGKLLVDGAMSMEVPSRLLREMGADRVLAVHLPVPAGMEIEPSNAFQVVNRCFQIMQGRTEHSWRQYSDLVLQPDVRGVGWDGFQSAAQLMEAGERAAELALPKIKAWLTPKIVVQATRGSAPASASRFPSGSSPAAA